MSDAVFHASNGVRLTPGGYLSPGSDLIVGSPEGIQQIAAAREEAREQGFAVGLDAQRLHAWSPDPVDDERKPGGFTFTRISDIIGEGLKPIQWLVRNYVEADSLALMFGDPGCGKSFAAIDLACCIATGTPWHRNKTTPGAVFYIAGEGQNGLARRFAAWSQHNSVSLAAAPLYVSRRPAQLCSATAAAEVANAVQELEDASGQTPALIVIDTLARNFGGADENSAQDMGAFISNLDTFLRASWEATVLVVHHSGHADKSRARGSTALKGALDAEYSLTKDDTGVVRIEATKMKDAEQPPPLAFRLDTITLAGLEDEDGQPVTSAALSSVTHVPPPRAGKTGRGKNQSMALSLLAELLAQQRTKLERSGHNPDGARVKVDAWRDRLVDAGINKQRFYELRTTLVDAGLIEVEFGGYVRPIEDTPL